MKKLTLHFMILTFTFSAQAKMFSNSYVSFQLPDNWSCKQNNTEWVCRSANNEQAKQAIIVFTAKEVGPNDNFAYYNQYLKSPKTPRHRDGTVSTASKVQHLKTVNIGNSQWIDALHLGSLLPNFYSRYLITIKGRVSVLVTFSAKKEVYTQYSRNFFESINSLKVTAPDFKIPIANSNHVDGGLNGGDPMDSGPDWSDTEGSINVTDNGEKSSNLPIYGVALLLIGAAAFFLLRRKK
jgi:LPXTG-motif cell wall-anchored protein